MIKNRSQEIRQHEDKLRARAFAVDKLLNVLRSSNIDPSSMDFRKKSRDQIVDDLALDLIKIRADDKATKKKHPQSNARASAILEDSVVSEIVVALVELYAPDMPSGLLSLLQVCLDPKLRNRTPRPSMDDERARAAVEIAHNPSLSTRELAKIVGVDQSTISRWKTEPEFGELVARLNVPR